MVVDDSLCMRIYSFIDYILINKTIKQIKQKIDFTVFCVRHLGLIVTAVTINGFTPVLGLRMTHFRLNPPGRGLLFKWYLNNRKSYVYTYAWSHYWMGDPSTPTRKL